MKKINKKTNKRRYNNMGPNYEDRNSSSRLTVHYFLFIYAGHSYRHKRLQAHYRHLSWSSHDCLLDLYLWLLYSDKTCLTCNIKIKHANDSAEHNSVIYILSSYICILLRNKPFRSVVMNLYLYHYLQPHDCLNRKLHMITDH